MRKWKLDVMTLDGLGEERILEAAALGTKLSVVLCSWGVSAKGFNAWIAAQPHRQMAWHNARPWSQQGEQHGRTQEAAR